MVTAPRPSSAKPAGRRRLLLIALLLVAALAVVPSLAAGGVGRLIGDLWVTTISAIAALFGGG